MSIPSLFSPYLSEPCVGALEGCPAAILSYGAEKTGKSWSLFGQSHRVVCGLREGGRCVQEVPEGIRDTFGVISRYFAVFVRLLWM